MSYIPKYIIKRLITENGVQLEGDMLKFTLVNVISPITIDEIPEDFLNFIEIKIDDKVVLNGTDQKANGDKMHLKFVDKEFTVQTFKQALGLIIPVGGTGVVKFPNVLNLEKGSTHKFAVTIKLNNPVNIEFERKVC